MKKIYVRLSGIVILAMVMGCAYHSKSRQKDDGRSPDSSKIGSRRVTYEFIDMKPEDAEQFQKDMEEVNPGK
ncbi:MAG: hypothetical protein QM755_02335 [Luteolibacter sp.]